jgi:putative methyltransferase
MIIFNFNNIYIFFLSKLPKNIAILLVHDLLFSSNGIKNLSDGPYKTAIMRNEIRLSAELVKLKIKLKVKNNEDLISSDYRNSGIIIENF